MLTGRVALITGGASGIGRAIALRLAEDGAHICILSLNRDKVQLLPKELKYFASTSDLEETSRAIEGLGSRCLAMEGDVSVSADVARTVSTAVEKFGRIDILVNNAATSCVQAVLDHHDGAFLRVLMVNLYGPYLCAKAVLPHMISGGWGRIISIASTSAHVGAADYSAYTASKHGLLGFSRSLALEVAQHNITVNTVSPATVETDSTPLHLGKWAEQAGLSLEEVRKQRVNDYPQKRFIQPREIAAVVAFLCRDEARAINGEDIRVTTGAMW
jgi:NAD(P)-dependent dehydrogenase (short-subunit alcohol dehydrogenase family)